MIREMTKPDFEAFWPVFHTIVKARETYAFDPDMNFEEGWQLWCEMPIKTFVYEESGKILGSYYIKANAMGPGSHICNCGYMVSEASRGKGIASQLCLHSQAIAAELGFRAMQFNAVVSTNDIAVRLWQNMGFQIIGTIPDAYQHGQLGYVDSYIMYKVLVETD
ncbi:GNAT family N-acetyltransferase [Oceanospirillum sediminis]|uniref:GNAT family N-acetyltransferase n=1 Tax=Oceanospirillum sediminis TaxID=2760088 RepID=A0A839IQH7_9GAMM|nr:GNAT family N-acetyltransferase [Oceanospirillum sediminis]MBB1486749.1 GNAT family N-acetyltransferase [Oceanospirillum sediminis]